MAGPNDMAIFRLPSAKHTNNYGKSPFLMGKSTISMAIFNSYVKLPEGICWLCPWTTAALSRLTNQPLLGSYERMGDEWDISFWGIRI